MSTAELVVRVLAQVQPLLPYMLIVTAMTTAALAALLLASRGLWVDQRRFQWLGLFFSLSTGDCVRLACAWVKLLMLLSLLAGFQKLEIAKYLLFLVPGVVYALWPRRLARLPGRLAWLSVEFAGLLSCGLICGYIRDMQAGLRYYLIYIAMALFTALFGLYIFLTELDDISNGRSANLERYREEDTDA